MSDQVIEQPQVLGRFQYHTMTVVLERVLGDSRYKVTFTDDQYPCKAEDAFICDHLSEARRVFENTSQGVINRTALSDVSTFMQNHVRSTSSNPKTFSVIPELCTTD